MRLSRLRRTVWAGWLGVMALALDALVPIHAAFDFAEAAGGENHSLEWRLLALASGHDTADHEPDEHGSRHNHAAACAVCSVAGVLAGFVLAPPVLLPGPRSPAAVAVVTVVADAPTAAPAVPYRSRAPPIA
jgi:hypothetical protein